MKAKIRDIIFVESADDKIRGKKLRWKKKKRKKRKIQTQPYLQYTHKVVPNTVGTPLAATHWDTRRDRENQYEIVRLTKNDKIRKNLLLLGEGMLRIAADPNTSHILNMTGKTYTEMLRREVPFRHLLKSRELRRIAVDTGLHPISIGWALFKGVGDIAVSNVMKNRKLSYQKEHIRKSFDEFMANQDIAVKDIQNKIKDFEYLISYNQGLINQLNKDNPAQKRFYLELHDQNDMFKEAIEDSEMALRELETMNPEKEAQARERMKEDVRELNKQALRKIYVRQIPDIANTVLHSITAMKARQDEDKWGKEGDKYLSRKFSRKWWQEEIGDDRLKIEKRVRKTFENDMAKYLFDRD